MPPEVDYLAGRKDAFAFLQRSPRRAQQQHQKQTVTASDRMIGWRQSPGSFEDLSSYQQTYRSIDRCSE